MHQKTKQLNELFEQYKKKQINRDQIMKIMNMSDMAVINAINRRKIRIWDRKKRGGNCNLEKYRRIYEQKKMDRKEICKKFGLNFKSLTTSIRNFNIEFWDLKFQCNGKKDYPGQFHNPKKDRSSYARLFYEYNN